MTEDVVILEPGDDRAQKIGKALANRTANDIISMLKSSDMTLTEISEKLNQPMTSTKYHVENLLDAGLIEVKKIKYSEKGREVKVYAASGQVVIVSPGVKDIRQILLKYASVFGIFLFAALIMTVGASTLFAGMPFYKGTPMPESADAVYMTVYSTPGSPYDNPYDPYNPDNPQHGKVYIMSNKTGDDQGVPVQSDDGHGNDQHGNDPHGYDPHEYDPYDTHAGGIGGNNDSERYYVTVSNADVKQQIAVGAAMHTGEPARDNSPAYIIAGFIIGGATVIVCLAATEIYAANRAANGTKRGKKDTDEKSE